MMKKQPSETDDDKSGLDQSEIDHLLFHIGKNTEHLENLAQAVQRLTGDILA